MVLHTVMDPFNEILEVVLHLLGDVVDVKTALMGITNDGCLAVVSRNDDEAVRGVEDVEGRFVFVRCIGGRKLQVICSHELGSNGFGGSQVDRVGKRAKEQPENSDA